MGLDEKKSYLVTLKNGESGLRVFVQPKAKKTKILGFHDDSVKVGVAAPPIDGKANQELVQFLARFFSLKKKEVEIVSGTHSRKKLCCLKNITADDVLTRLVNSVHKERET